MIKLESSKMQKAIERAKQVRPRVRCTGERIYSVTGRKGDLYTVRFAVANGHNLAECDCRAGQSSQLCYHIAAAAAVNIAVHSNYARPSESPKAVTMCVLASALLIKREGKAVIIDGWMV
jgi:SWIM zinc finger